MKQQIIIQPSTVAQIVEIEIPVNITVTPVSNTTTTTTTTKIPVTTTTTTTNIPITTTTTTTTKIPITTTTTTTTSIPSGTPFLTLPISARKDINGSNIIIENLRFVDISGVSINITGGNNITIRNCFFDRASEEAISIENASNVTVENCLFNGVVTGVYALNASTIKVKNCQFVNVRMRSQGGRGQFVQFNSVNGAGNLIENNKGENFAGESDPEDMISMYNSSGTSTSPIIIRNNMFRGGGPSDSGGGIMTGDSGGGWQIVENNKLLNPGNYIYAASGGSNIIIRNNQGYQGNFPWTNIAMYAYGGQQGANCSNITVQGNAIGITNGNTWYAGDGSPAEDCGSITGAEPFTQTNRTNLTPGEMNFPAHLITFITPAELLTIRN